MVVDYSKWDKLELSDDSDIEVHPNVDKRSFIRWKQQDIHQKRIQRNQDIHTLEIQIPMYEELNRRVDQLLNDNDDPKLGDYDGIQKYLKVTFDQEKPNGVEDDAPSYTEMIEDLFIQLKSQLEKAQQNPNDGKLLRDEILNHRKKIDDVLFKNKDKLQSLYKERQLHISSEDIHTGWDRSFLNKGDGSSEKLTTTPAAQPVSKDTITSSLPTISASATSTTSGNTSSSSANTISTPQSSTAESTAISQSSTSNQVAVKSSEDDDDDELEDLHPDTLKLSQISTSSIPQIKSFLKTHTHIINPQQKDSLLMKAFDSQFARDDNRTKQIIFHSTLLQYVYDIIDFKKTKQPLEIANIVDQLIGKMFESGNTNNPALSAFIGEVERTYQHIKTRAKILSEESNDQEPEQEIQLKSLDDNAELVVNLPDPTSDDPEELQRYEIFKTLPQNMIDALKTESLDSVNEVFHGLPIEEAEEILEIFEQCQVIGVQALIENENDWKEIKGEYEKSHSGETNFPKIEELEVDDQDKYVETGDIVD